MPRAPRAVQTPGAAPVETTETATDTTDLGVSDAQEAKATKGKATDTPDYINMHSSEVDATKLKRSVLCKDGWVVPDLPPRAPVRA